MDLEATEKLRLDKRLRDRRGWISDDDLARALAEIPDSSGKAEGLSAPEAPAQESE